MFDWTLYLKLAERLYASAADEADLRSAVSRAYYAAFNEARQYVRREFPEVFIDKDAAAHGKVWDTLASKGRSREEVETGRRGNMLRRDRNKADYDGTVPVKHNQVRLVIRQANDIIDALYRTGGG
ncbi:hypothetical protein [Polyangium aurulentum]|uniref:hypothetical protein n=1 Tax=Polyangium aurulentum TaxID=2567896 RepID=UPI0010ADE06F|nr:hypothetical protein [Polyangium aurulentum]UQA57776.1 hypothetical protein E8A73_041945 [Polyangium aurulentum]